MKNCEKCNIARDGNSNIILCGVQNVVITHIEVYDAREVVFHPPGTPLNKKLYESVKTEEKQRFKSVNPTCNTLYQGL